MTDLTLAGKSSNAFRKRTSIIHSPDLHQTRRSRARPARAPDAKKLDAVLDGTTSRLDVKTAEKAFSTAFTVFGLGECKGNVATIYEAAQRYSAALFELHDRQKSERPLATLETGKDYANLALQRIGGLLRLDRAT